jgi:hypothetical protein
MTRLVFLSVMAVSCACAQQGNLKGVVLAPDGLPVPLASVEVKNTQTGLTKSAAAAETGEYLIAGLPVGTYDVAVTSIRYLARFEKKAVAVAAGDSNRLEIRLGYVTMGGTPGEGHEPALASLRRKAPQGPTPRLADGKPDFNGVWSWPNTTDPGLDTFLPAAAPNGSLTPATYCLPHAVLWPNAFMKLVQTPKLMVVLYDDEDPSYRQIYLDGRAHPKNEDPTWYGHSVGHWEGDTLVVDRVGFNAKGWLDGAGHRYTEQLHVTERYRRPDYGHLEMETTLDDSGVMRAPTTVKRLSVLMEGDDVREYPCNENNVDPPHMNPTPAKK